MDKTIIGAFENNSEALQAKQQLLSSGFAERSIDLHSSTEPEPEPDASYPNDNPGFMAAIRSLFTWDINDYRDESYGDHYVEAVRRGHAVLSINVNEDQVERACEIMDEAGALDSDEKVSEWRSQGYAGGQQDDTGIRNSEMNTGVTGAPTAAVAADQASSGLDRSATKGSASGAAGDGRGSVGSSVGSGVFNTDLDQGSVPGYEAQGVTAPPSGSRHVRVISRNHQTGGPASNP